MARFSFFTILAFLILIASSAWGDCVADDNNTEVSATPLALGAMVTGTVCPTTDPFDYYTVVIPEGADVSGNVIFTSPQASTVLRIYNASTGVRLVDDTATNDTTHEYTLHVAPGVVPGGTYYARVFFWSAAAYDHDYTLSINISAATAPTTPPVITAVGGLIYSAPVPVLRKSPWPNAMGDKYHRNNSSAMGPSGAQMDFKTYDVHLDSTGGGDPRDSQYSSLRVGPDGMIYLLDSNRGELIAYNSTSGFQWTKAVYATGSLALDDAGRAYCISSGGNKLWCVNPDGSTRWVGDLSDSGSSGVMLAGGRIHVVTQDAGTSKLVIFNLDGSFAWQTGPSAENISSTLEDTSGNIFVFSHGYFNKFNPAGVLDWSTPYSSTTFAPLLSAQTFSPMYGSDDRLWLTRPMLTFSIDGGGRASTQYDIFNSDGSDYKNAHFTADDTPSMVCYSGVDGLLLSITASSEIRACDDWDNQRWRIPLPHPGAVQDMIVDGAGRVYILATSTAEAGGGVRQRIYTIDPGSGAVTRDLLLNQLPDPGYANAACELAILGDGSLVYLNSMGFLKVIAGIYSPLLSAPPVGIVMTPAG